MQSNGLKEKNKIRDRGNKDLMGNEKEYLSDMRDNYAKAHGDLFLKVYSNEFRDETLKNKVKALKFEKISEEFISIIDKSIKEANKLMHFAVDDTKEVREYHSKYEKQLNQVQNCSKCECIDCAYECKFSSCGNCLSGCRVKDCDKKETCIIESTKTLKLYNDEKERDVDFEILAIVESNAYDKKYILLQEKDNEDNKQMFIMTDGLGDTEYINIENEEELESIAGLFMES